MTPARDPVTLDNCDREPIHIPGNIQAHGALLGFDAAGRLAWASANAHQVLGVPLPALGEVLAPAHFGGAAAVHQAIAEELAAAASPAFQPQQHEVQLAGRVHDLIVHRSEGTLVAEFEPRQAGAEDPAAFAGKAHRSVDKLRRQRSLDQLLQVAVEEVRALTGFDRVMAYRFRHDASGDVVAEARSEALEPFVGRRYPASDIPAQARRLYVINTLRMIADVGSRPVPVEGTSPQPLDMSHSVLRSVSPVHIEYLTNMGVGASMSVSLVIGGQLWGMLACHHMAPRQVPYAVRMACDVVGQILAANVQSFLAQETARRAERAASLRARLVERMLHAEDPVAALAPLSDDLLEEFAAQASVFAEGANMSVHGDLAPATARALLAWLEGPDGLDESRVLARHSLDGLPPALAAELGTWCGILALRYDDTASGWLVLLRREQVESIDWGGRPEKHYENGPLGPRLTPRGSFEVWREEVRGKAVPWSRSDLETARQLLDELIRATGARHAEHSRAKNQLMAVLGHDLRNPLQTISMAAHVLEKGADAGKLGQRIQSSSTRMQRLISQVLDMSRLQAGLGLGFLFDDVDVSRLVDELVEDALLAHPGLVIDRQVQPGVHAQADADRLAQLLGNLLSNARHHGEPGQPVSVALDGEGAEVVLRVRNHARPIDETAVAQLFTPFKRQALGNERNKGGLGLGLYIAREIARGHGGTLDYTYEAPQVVFTARLPARRGA